MINYEINYNNFISKFNNLINSSEFEIIDKFKQMNQSIIIKHKICGNIIKITPKQLFRKENKNFIKCKCNKQIKNYTNKKKTHEEFLKDLKEKNVLHIPLENYINAKTPILFKCYKCGNKWSIKPDSIYNSYKNGCPYCRPTSEHKNHSVFLEEVEKLFPGEYTILEKYTNAKTKILVKHNFCGHEWKISPDNLKRGKGCPICNRSSKGEYKIIKFLENNNIKYKKEFSFENSNYRYDFCIFNNDESIKCLIEYDGIQHFKEMEFFGGKQGLINNNNRDKEKDILAINNNIKLYRIKYTDIDNINLILSDIINKDIVCSY